MLYFSVYTSHLWCDSVKSIPKCSKYSANIQFKLLESLSDYQWFFCPLCICQMFPSRKANSDLMFWWLLLIIQQCLFETATEKWRHGAPLQNSRTGRQFIVFFLTIIGRNDLPGSGTLMYLTGYMNRAAIKSHCVAYFMWVKCGGLPLVKRFSLLYMWKWFFYTWGLCKSCMLRVNKNIGIWIGDWTVYLNLTGLSLIY